MQYKFAAIAMIMIIMIGMTGMASAATTVTYTGDGYYYSDFSGSGVGSLYIDTYTSNGADHLGVVWDNADISGSQDMTNNGWTMIDRGVEVCNEDWVDTSQGVIGTLTYDMEGNTVEAGAAFVNDDSGCGCIYMEQEVGFGDGLETMLGDADGVVADTLIYADTCGDDNYVTGFVGAVSDDGSYAYTGINISGCGFMLSTTAGAGNTSEYDGAGVEFYTDACGIGELEMGAGIDTLFGTDVDIYGDDREFHFSSYGYVEQFELVDDINDEEYEAFGYIYVIDLTSGQV